MDAFAYSLPGPQKTDGVPPPPGSGVHAGLYCTRNRRHVIDDDLIKEPLFSSKWGKSGPVCICNTMCAKSSYLSSKLSPEMKDHPNKNFYDTCE